MSENYDYQSLIISPSNNQSMTNNIIQVTPPVAVDFKDSQVCLASLFIYYSWFNVNFLQFNNANVSYQFNGVTTNVLIPNGSYSASDLGGYINFIQDGLNQWTYMADGVTKQYYINISENSVYYADTISLLPILLPQGGTNPNGIVLSGFCPQIIIPANSNFGLLLGFNPQTIPPTATQSNPYAVNSDFTPEINPVTAVNVICNIVNNFNFSGIQGYLASFNSGNVPFGGQIQFQPAFPLWFNILESRFPQVSLTFLDDAGRPLGINDENIVSTLYFRSPTK